MRCDSPLWGVLLIIWFWMYLNSRYWCRWEHSYYWQGGSLPSLNITIPINTTSITMIIGMIQRIAFSYKIRSSDLSKREGSISSSKEGHLYASHLQGPNHYHHQSPIKLQHNRLGGRLRKINLLEVLWICCPKPGRSEQAFDGSKKAKGRWNHHLLQRRCD